MIDTNVLVAALMSRRGKSFELLQLVGTGRFELVLSVSLVLEYEEVCKRWLGTKILVGVQQIDDLLDYLCTVGHHQKVYYLWRPGLHDPKDDLVLEVAVSAGCQFIVTFNLRDFAGCSDFGIEAITPKEFLKRVGD